MKTVKPLLMGLLAGCLTSALIGCRHPRVTVIDPNTTVVRLWATNAFNAPCPGYFVPDATMLRILDRLSEKDVFGK